MNYTKVINNAKWIVVCKVIQSLLQLIVGMLTARFLGPSNYGLIKYAASVVAFALPFMRLGFDSTLVHEFVEAPEKEGEIVGTSMLMNLMSGFGCIGMVTLFSYLANSGDKETVLVCVLYSISLVFAALEMIQYWFQFMLKSKQSSVVMLVAYGVVTAYKTFLLVTSKNIYWFAFSNSVEYAVIAVLLIMIYLRSGGKLRFSLSVGKKMFGRSKHYILASLMLVVLQNTDHIMLTAISGTEENGFYSSAITCTTVLQFVYLALIDSFRPVILENKKHNLLEFELNVSRLYSITFYVSLAQSIVFTFLAGIIINVLYGSEYASAVPVLRILTWYFTFSVMGVVRNVWILAEQKQKYLWIINLSGALFNIVLNIFLIPHWGACGAAFASLLTQFVMNFMLGFFMKPIRENNRLILKGINPKFMIKESKNLIGILLDGFKKKKEIKIK